jgi:hypothetical protein
VIFATYKTHVKAEYYLLTSTHIRPYIPRTLEKIPAEYQVAGIQQVPQKINLHIRVYVTATGPGMYRGPTLGSAFINRNT